MLQDDALYQAIAKADAAVDKARREAEARKWRIVADDLKLKKVKHCPLCFSQTLANAHSPSPTSRKLPASDATKPCKQAPLSRLLSPFRTQMRLFELALCHAARTKLELQSTQRWLSTPSGTLTATPGLLACGSTSEGFSSARSHDLRPRHTSGCYRQAMSAMYWSDMLAPGNKRYCMNKTEIE